MENSNNNGINNEQNKDNVTQSQPQINNEGLHQHQAQWSQYNNQPQDGRRPEYNQQQSQQYYYGGQQMYQQQFYNQQPDNNYGTAIAALVCGILSILVNCCAAWYISLPVAIAGIILGVVTIKNNKAGRTMAIVGIILSSIAALIGLILLIGCAIIVSNRELMEQYYRQIYKQIYDIPWQGYDIERFY